VDGITLIFMLLFGMLFFAVVAVYFFLSLPVLPYIISRILQRDMLVVLGRNGRMKFMSADYKSLEIVKNAAWLPKEPVYYNFAGVQVAVVYDAWGVLLNPEMLSALEELAKYGVKDYADLKLFFDRINDAKDKLKILEPIVQDASLLIRYGVYDKSDLDALSLDSRTISKLREAYDRVEEYANSLSGKKGEKENRKVTAQLLRTISDSLNILSLESVAAKALTLIDMNSLERYFYPMYPQEIKAMVDEKIAEIAEDYRGGVAKVAAYAILGLIVLMGGAIGFSIVWGVLTGGGG